MRILLVAPDVGLPHATDELSEIVNVLRPAQVLAGTVRAVDLLRALRSKFDLIWFISHGQEGGILLSDGVISANRLAQYLRRHRPAVFLNTCDSDEIAIAIHDTTSSPVIFTETDIDDAEAAELGMMLAHNLADGASLAESFEMSRPPDRQNYRMIGRDTDYPDRFDSILDLIMDTAERLERRIDDIDQRVGRVESDMQRRFDQLQLQVVPTRKKGLNWLVGYVIFALVIPITFVDVRTMLDLTARSGLGVAFLLLLLSLIFFLRGMGFQFLAENHHD